MPANSFQNAQTPDGLYAVPAGELHLFDETDRTSGSFDINVNPTTAFVEHDLSARVPKGTKALWSYCEITPSDALAFINIRDANSAATNDYQSIVLGSGTQHGQPIIIKATDGIFDIREWSATFEASSFKFQLWGYFI